jgi:hypothetical protein
MANQQQILYNGEPLLRPAFSSQGGIHHVNRTTGYNDYVPPVKVHDTITMSFTQWLKYHSRVTDKHVFHPIPYETEELGI